MPYLAHFGLKEHPFTLTPNIDYYYPTQENANIIASLEFALRRESGIVKIVGEVGTGKTLLCRLLIDKLEKTDAVAYINAPQADAGSIVAAVCEEFGIRLDAGTSPYSALNRFLVAVHEQGKLAVVVIDEAQHLGREGLEAIRLVSNLETEKSKLLQIVLFGQTELDSLLANPDLRQLNQRVVFSFSTKPLTLAEGKRYIAHRIRVSRREGVEYEVFSPEALAILAERSGGIPRVVNIIADKSLLVAFSEGSPTVQRAHALEAVRDTPGLVTPANPLRTMSCWIGEAGRRVALAVGVAILAAAVGGGLFWLGAHQKNTGAATLPSATSLAAAPAVAPVPSAPPASSPEPPPPLAPVEDAVTPQPAAPPEPVPPAVAPVEPPAPAIAIQPAAPEPPPVAAPSVAPPPSAGTPAEQPVAVVPDVKTASPSGKSPVKIRVAKSPEKSGGYLRHHKTPSPAVSEPPLPAAAQPVTPVSVQPVPPSSSPASTPSSPTKAASGAAETAPVTELPPTAPGRPGVYGVESSH